MVTWNRVNLTKLCIERLLSTNLENSLIHIIDNGSTDGTKEYLSHLSTRYDRLKVYFLRRNYGVAIAANFGWSLLDSDYYIKLDNDIEILDKNWLKYLICFAERNKEVGMVGYRLLEKHKITSVYLSSGDLFHQSGGCGGGVVCISRKIHQCYGFWNEDYGCYGFEDLDYNNRVVLSGYKIGYCPNDNIVKHIGYESDINIDNEKIKFDSVNDITKGEKLYLLNKFLFENKIRDIYVSRKFLPIQKNGNIYFQQSIEYNSILKIQKQLMNNVTYTKNGDTIALDLKSLKL
jgi:GT2 family glycosyltransferase